MSAIDQLISDLDDSFIDDFDEAVGCELDNVERQMMEIRHHEECNAHLEKTLVSIENLKMNCRLIFIDPLLLYLQGIEDVVTYVRDGKMPVSEHLWELILIAFDEVRAAKDDLSIHRKIDKGLLSDFSHGLKELLAVPKADVERKIKSMILEFSKRVHPDLVFSANEIRSGQPIRESSSDVEIDSATKDDLSFFKDIAESVDCSSNYLKGKSRKIANISLLINSHLSDPVDVPQLLAAVYLHDMTMTFLPHKILYKKGKYTSEERMMLEQHPIQGYGFLSRLPRWKSAAQIVRQHHERVDGSGYPNALGGAEICVGAKILSIADAYFALTCDRADRPSISPLQTIAEINKNCGTQFDPEVLKVFNTAALSVTKEIRSLDR